MSIREKLAGLGSAVKEKVGAAFGDPDLRAAEQELDAQLAAEGVVTTAPAAPAVTPSMDEATARAVLGLGEQATLDEVRAAAVRLSRPAVAGTAANDDVAHGALGRIATAAELLEERLLPLADAAPPPGPAGPQTSPGTRTRATARR